MNVEKTTRFFIFAYPVFVLALVAWGWLNYRDVGTLREKLDNVKDAARQEVENAEDEHRITGKDVELLNIIASQWSGKLERRASEVPVMLDSLTRNVNVDLSDYRSSGKMVEETTGYVFEEGESTVRGTFSRLLAFLNVLENNPDFYVEITSVNFRPARENAVHEMRLAMRVLLDSVDIEEEG